MPQCHEPFPRRVARVRRASSVKAKDVSGTSPKEPGSDRREIRGLRDDEPDLDGPPPDSRRIGLHFDDREGRGFRASHDGCSPDHPDSQHRRLGFRPCRRLRLRSDQVVKFERAAMDGILLGKGGLSEQVHGCRIAVIMDKRTSSCMPVRHYAPYLRKSVSLLYASVSSADTSALACGGVTPVAFLLRHEHY